MPAPVSWTGTPTSENLWASFPGGVGAPHVKIPLRGGKRRTRRSKTRRSRRTHSRRAHRPSRK